MRCEVDALQTGVHLRDAARMCLTVVVDLLVEVGHRVRDVRGDQAPEPFPCRGEPVLDEPGVHRDEIGGTGDVGGQISVPAEGHSRRKRLGGADDAMLGVVTLGVGVRLHRLQRVAQVRADLAVTLQREGLAGLLESAVQDRGQVPAVVLGQHVAVVAALQLGEPPVPVAADVPQLVVDRPPRPTASRQSARATSTCSSSSARSTRFSRTASMRRPSSSASRCADHQFSSAHDE